MHNSIPISLFLVIVIAALSGLSAAITVPIFMITILINIRKKMIFDILDYKLELSLFTYLIISAFFAINIGHTLITIFKLSLIFFFTALIWSNIHLIENSSNISKSSNITWLITAFLIALFIIYLEILTSGIIATSFRKAFQTYKNPAFYLHFLDRTCTIISMLAWVVIATLIKRKMSFAALILYLFVLFTLSITDSLASFVAFALSGIVFALIRYVALFRNPLLLSFIFVLSALAMILFAFSIDANNLAEEAQFLPLSAKHRLFIWEYIANASTNNIFTGIGLANSRFIEILPAEMIDLDGTMISPLPLHPHNVVMQILFETGIIGLVLFLLIGCKYIIIIGYDYYKKDLLSINMLAASYACFTTYFIIAMISYNFWQSWWIMTTSFIVITTRYFMNANKG